jgi:leucyl-tRNA synthetase
MMILINNGLPKSESLQAEWKQVFVKLLHPFAPHLAEELNERIGNTESVFKSTWPIYDESKTVDNTITI